jgi:hypothetical protein
MPYLVGPPGQENVVFPVLLEEGNEHGGPHQSGLVDTGLFPAGQDLFNLFFHFYSATEVTARQNGNTKKLATEVPEITEI